MHAESVNRTMPEADALIQRAQLGDAQSFNQLTNLWYKRIYNYVLKQCSDSDLTADITQRTFISVYKNLVKLKEIDRFKPWIYRIATNYCYEEGRKKMKRAVISQPLQQTHGDEEGVNELDGEAKELHFNPERSFQQLELEKILFECLQDLSEDQRTVIIMKEYEGMKFIEIAEVLDVSENTIKTRLYRGLKLLKDRLDERNITKETIHYEL